MTRFKIIEQCCPESLAAFQKVGCNQPEKLNV